MSSVCHLDLLFLWLLLLPNKLKFILLPNLPSSWKKCLFFVKHIKILGHLFWVTVLAVSIAKSFKICWHKSIISDSWFSYLGSCSLWSIFKYSCCALYCSSSFPELFIIVWSWMEQYVFLPLLIRTHVSVFNLVDRFASY